MKYFGHYTGRWLVLVLSCFAIGPFISVHSRRKDAAEGDTPPSIANSDTSTTEHTQTVQGHIPALDALRGIAILLVMIHHFTSLGGMTTTTILDKIFYKVTYIGWTGVDLFFVLSGFLITRILYQAKGTNHFFRNFYMRRALRIFPLYFGFLLVVLVLIPRLTTWGEQIRLPLRDQLWYWTYGVNFLIAMKGWNAFSMVAIHHFWSLAVEEQFYLVWPLVIFFFRRRSLIFVCMCLIITSFALRLAFGLAHNTDAAYVLTPTRMGALVTGAMLALIASDVRTFDSLARPARITALITGGALALMFLWRRGLFSTDIVVLTVGYRLLSLFFVAFLVIAITESPKTLLGRCFSSRGLRFLGTYSYGLYVFHQPVIHFLHLNGLSASMGPAVFGSHLLGQFLFSSAAASVSVGLAFLSWHFFERHFLKLKKLFRYQSERLATVSGTTS